MTENEIKKEYLREYRWHVRKIRRIEAELAELRAMKTSVSVVNDGMPHGAICPGMLRSWISWNGVWYRKGIAGWWLIKRYPVRSAV